MRLLESLDINGETDTQTHDRQKAAEWELKIVTAESGAEQLHRAIIRTVNWVTDGSRHSFACFSKKVFYSLEIIAPALLSSICCLIHEHSRGFESIKPKLSAPLRKSLVPKLPQ